MMVYRCVPQVLQGRDADKIALCSEYMHYLMTGLEALPPYSVEGTDTILWRGVNRFDLKHC
jgi:hypothetical protein